MTQRQRKTIAVIGAGISGLAAAWLLDKRHDVTLYEAARRTGGHANTVRIAQDGGTVAVDTGFIVYNELTYPNLTALFGHLGVATCASDMSFAVSLRSGGLEYSGSGLAGLFAQKRNLLRPRFLAMLRDVVRFYRTSPAALARLDGEMSLGALLDAGGYGAALREDHLLPMAGAIWSAAPRKLLDHPARAFIEFFVNHQLFNLGRRVDWRTVKGGSRVYVEAMMRQFRGVVQVNSAIGSITRGGDGAIVNDRRHGARRFDAVVIATHADQALRLLADPSAKERRLLGAFRYSRNRTVLHRDAKLMPRRRQVWSSWNFLGAADDAEGAPCVTYWMNRLQQLETSAPLFVTLNPIVPPEAALHEEIYEHPLFDRSALRAQNELWSLQGRQSTWFCGAYFGSGFHEDGLQAGLAVAEMLGGGKRPWRVADESGRIGLSAPAAAAPHRQAA